MMTMMYCASMGRCPYIVEPKTHNIAARLCWLQNCTRRLAGDARAHKYASTDASGAVKGEGMSKIMGCTEESVAPQPAETLRYSTVLCPSLLNAHQEGRGAPSSTQRTRRDLRATFGGPWHDLKPRLGWGEGGGTRSPPSCHAPMGQVGSPTCQRERC